MTIMLKTGLIMSREMVSLDKMKREDTGEKLMMILNRSWIKELASFTEIISVLQK